MRPETGIEIPVAIITTGEARTATITAVIIVTITTIRITRGILTKTTPTLRIWIILRKATLTQAKETPIITTATIETIIIAVIIHITTVEEKLRLIEARAEAGTKEITEQITTTETTGVVTGAEAISTTVAAVAAIPTTTVAVITTA
jgi:hypothetical protein